MLRFFVIALLLAVAPVATAAELAIPRFWIGARELGVGWEIVDEVPTDAAADPDLRGWGVRAQGARHYTRHRGPDIEVCSVEIWSFASAPQARAAHEGFAYPDWSIDREGRWLLMLRGLRMTRGGPALRGVFPGCREIGRRVRDRIARAATAEE